MCINSHVGIKEKQIRRQQRRKEGERGGGGCYTDIIKYACVCGASSPIYVIPVL